MSHTIDKAKEDKETIVRNLESLLKGYYEAYGMELALNITYTHVEDGSVVFVNVDATAKLD